MFLTRLIYVSRPAFTIEPPKVGPELQQIIEAGLRHNPANAITGLLVIDNGLFMQVLEGPRATVSKTTLRIATDRRHADMEIVAMEETAGRQFSDWSVAFADPDALPRNEPRRADYALLPADALLARARRIRRTGALVSRPVENRAA